MGGNVSTADRRLANLLGAFACALGDEVERKAEQSTQRSVASAIALIQLEPQRGGSLAELQSALGLTQPSVTRIVQKLRDDGLVDVVRQGADGRVIHINLTTRGLESRTQALKGRESAILPLIAALDQQQHQAVQTLIERALTVLTPDRAASDRACRFCDLGVCPQERCPAEPNSRR